MYMQTQDVSFPGRCFGISRREFVPESITIGFVTPYQQLQSLLGNLVELISCHLRISFLTLSVLLLLLSPSHSLFIG